MYDPVASSVTVATEPVFRERLDTPVVGAGERGDRGRVGVY